MNPQGNKGVRFTPPSSHWKESYLCTQTRGEHEYASPTKCQFRAVVQSVRYKQKQNLTGLRQDHFLFILSYWWTQQPFRTCALQAGAQHFRVLWTYVPSCRGRECWGVLDWMPPFALHPPSPPFSSQIWVAGGWPVWFILLLLIMWPMGWLADLRAETEGVQECYSSTHWLQGHGGLAASLFWGPELALLFSFSLHSDNFPPFLAFSSPGALMPLHSYQIQGVPPSLAAFLTSSPHFCKHLCKLTKQPVPLVNSFLLLRFSRLSSENGPCHSHLKLLTRISYMPRLTAMGLGSLILSITQEKRELDIGEDQKYITEVQQQM